MWAAAWLDTEGHVCLHYGVANPRHSRRPSFRLKVGIAQICREPLDRLRTAFGGWIYVSQSHRRRAIHSWTLNSFKATVFLRAVQPYLIVKAVQARLGVEAGQIISSGRGGRGTRRPVEQTRRLAAIKDALHELNGWTPERLVRFREYYQRVGPKPMLGWSLAHAACRNCGTTECPHRGLGLCRRCYCRAWQQEQTATRRYDPAKPGPKGPRMPVQRHVRLSAV